MQHQDWKTVVFHTRTKPSASSSGAGAATATVSAVTGKPAWKIEAQVDAEGGGKPVERIPTDVRKMLVQLRTSAKLSQRDLARHLNLPVDTIQKMESGSALENKALIQKVKRFLESCSKA